jgi:redox-sensitive bicupin YhaK (pirin superfamily)
MTAGKGVQHCEMFPLLYKEKENPLELFQIWLNLPKAKKMVAPHFAMLWNDAIPTFSSKDENGKTAHVRVIAGKIENVKAPDPAPNSWAADANNEVAIWTIKLEANASWKLPTASASVNRSLYFYQGGSIQIAEKNFTSHQAVELHADQEIIVKNGSAESYLLLLQGKPIGEPVVQHGPFVMNTSAEIQQAMNEYRQTEFGGWPWDTYEHVHERSKTRFAKYPDGKEEVKPLL